ncbi:MAG: TonB-dependent receptor [Sterolibacterium sp.]|jgi:iron complex outermembrane receptor protein
MKSSHGFTPIGLRLALTGLSAAAVTCGAYAQTAEQAAGSASADSIQTITVTAQRRSQKISDVPISVSSITGDALAERGVTELHEVAEQMAGVQIFRLNQGQPTWMIRGVGLADFSPNNNPAAAVFQDDVYQVSSALGQVSLFDVSRVEVLKGPQSGLYGRNTSAGAVRVVSNLAEFGQLNGEAKGSVGTWNTTHASGVLAGTMVPGKLAGRLAVDFSGGGESRMHLLPSNTDWGKQDKQAARGSLLWQITPGARFTFIGELAQDKSQVLPINATGYRKLPSGLCSAVLSGYQDNNSCLTWGGYVNTVLRNQPGTNNPGTQDPGRTALADPFGAFDISSKALTVNGDFDLGGMKLVSVTHARGFDYGRSSENDGVAGEFARSVLMTKFKIGSQEFRLQSTRPGPLQWIVGASVMRDELSEDRVFYFRDAPSFVAGFAAYGVKSAAELAARVAYKQVTNSASVFGQADYALTDKVNLGAALRWTDESKTYRDGGFGFPMATGTVAAAVAPNANYQLAADYKIQAPWSGKLSVDWKPLPGLMTYATLSHGFKAGGFFGGFPLSGLSSILPYKEETVTAYELGAKTDAANRKLGGAVALYHYDYKDAQNFTNVFSTLLNTTIVRLDNVGRATHDGVDLEGWWRPVQKLRLSATVNFLNARFLDDKKYGTLGGIVGSYQGQKRPFAPSRSWTLGAEYDFSLANGSLRLGADVNGRSDLMQSFGTPVDRAIASLPGYTLANLHANYTSANGAWQYALIVRNATDKTYAVTYTNDGLNNFGRFYGEPRSVRAEVSYRFY